MKNLTNRLNANKISLNVKKTELVIFKHKKMKLECPLKIKLSRKRLYPSTSVKYLDVKIYEKRALLFVHCSIKLDIMLVLIL